MDNTLVPPASVSFGHVIKNKHVALEKRMQRQGQLGTWRQP